jgi:3'(2'), 5'-bisphosphate nucleotidase
MRQINLGSEFIAEVIAIAVDAGQAIMGIYAGQDHGVAQKKDDSPLTRADLAAHLLITDRLHRLTPSVPVVSEEDPNTMAYRSPEGEFWLIDPLDGTKEFIARNGEFTVNIALVRDGVAALGVIVAPVLGQTYWGSRAVGAFRHSGSGRAQIHVAAEVRPGNPVRIVASKSHLNAETERFIARLGTHDLVQAGSSLKFCRVAEGAADIYPRLSPTSEWDTAAAQAIVEAAGGCVLSMDGQPLRYGKPDVLNPAFVASSGSWFRKVASL